MLLWRLLFLFASVAAVIVVVVVVVVITVVDEDLVCFLIKCYQAV